MATRMVRQTSFNTGEVDPVVWKRTDAAEYVTAAQSLKNCEVGTTGLVKKRKGMELMQNVTAYADPNSRMYEFVDKNLIHYLLMSANEKFIVFTSPSHATQVITGRGTNVVTIRHTSVVAHSDSVDFIQEITTPYTTTELDEIDYTQDNDSLILSHASYPPARIDISSYSMEPPTFQYSVLDIYPYPSYDFNSINYNNFVVELSQVDTTLTFKFTGLSGDPGFNNAWVGGQIIGGGKSTDDPSILGYAIITAVSYSSGTTTFTSTVQVAFETDVTKYAKAGSQYSIRQPAWSAELGYPRKVLYYQNRLWFANTSALNNTIFGSKINSPINFDVGTGQADEAIVYGVGVTGSGQILWINGGKQLEVYCENVECACPQDQNSALTPTTFNIKQQSSYGAANRLKPITYINDSYYANRTGRAIINFHFNGVGLTYVASNISAASSHLAKNPNNRALLRGSDQTQDNFIYFLNKSDNTITAFQFANEFKLAALTPVVFQDDVELIDIVNVGNEIFVLKRYALNDQYTIERMHDDSKIDCSFSTNMDSTGLVTGLELLNGYTVQVVYSDQDYGQYLVTDGQITVANPLEISDTVIIGLLYDIEIIPMYAFYSPSSAPFMKNVTRVYVDYYQSLDFTINGTLVQYQNFSDIQAGIPLAPKTDTAIISPVSGWSRFDNTMLKIEQSSPFDLQILSIAYQIEQSVI